MCCWLPFHSQTNNHGNDSIRMTEQNYKTNRVYSITTVNGENHRIERRLIPLGGRLHEREAWESGRIQLLVHFHSLSTQVVDLVEVALLHRSCLENEQLTNTIHIFAKLASCIVFDALPHFRWLCLCLSQHLLVEGKNITLQSRMGHSLSSHSNTECVTTLLN